MTTNAPLFTGSDLPRLALDLGAADVGGPLSSAERWLLDRAATRFESEEQVIRDIREQIRTGEDPLGDLFCLANSSESRRATGTFYTPQTIVRAMVRWALETAPTRVIDPGCGSGRFSAEVARSDPEIPIVAIDTDPLACLMTRAALAVLGSQRSRVLNCDFITMSIGGHDGRTAFVGNPPYVRHHALPEPTKRRAMQIARDRGVRMSGLAGLHAYFFLATSIHGRPGDTGAYITSSEWLDVGYGSGVRQLLLDGLGGRSIAAFPERALPFADAMTTACVTTFELGRNPHEIAFKYVDSPQSSLDLDRAVRVSTTQLARANRWSPFLRGVVPEPSEMPSGTLGSLVRVHRGVATGANSFFVMTREKARQRGLLAWARPAITRAIQVLDSGGLVRDNPDVRVIIDLPGDIDRDVHAAVNTFLSEGERTDNGPASGYLARHRSPWWRLGVPPAPPVVASYMARRPPVFARNPDALVLLNVAHGIYPRAPLTAAGVDNLVDALNGAAASFVGMGRTYHGGLEKFEPREMEALPLSALNLEAILHP